MDLREVSLKQDRIFFLIIFLMGGLLNFMTMSLNDNRMPVMTDIYINDVEYFSYTGPETIKMWQGSDMIRIPLKNYEVLFSFGDILIVLGIIGLWYNQYKLLTLRRKVKNKK